jgi:hypothetical protein
MFEYSGSQSSKSVPQTRHSKFDFSSFDLLITPSHNNNEYNLDSNWTFPPESACHGWLVNCLFAHLGDCFVTCIIDTVRTEWSVRVDGNSLPPTLGILLLGPMCLSLIHHSKCRGKMRGRQIYSIPQHVGLLPYPMVPSPS